MHPRVRLTHSVWRVVIEVPRILWRPEGGNESISHAHYPRFGATPINNAQKLESSFSVIVYPSKVFPAERVTVFDKPFVSKCIEFAC
jgi:hypothetical protein